MNSHYNPSLKTNARELRITSTLKAEKFIWKALLSRNQKGVKFKRQRPIDHFIVDFFSQEIGLIVEIDGNSHSNCGDYDRYRQNRLESLGYSIIRFSEGEVLNEIDKVNERIVHAIYVLRRS
jgi:very-short-patch-repair endonuclease